MITHIELCNGLYEEMEFLCEGRYEFYVNKDSNNYVNIRRKPSIIGVHTYLEYKFNTRAELITFVDWLNTFLE